MTTRASLAWRMDAVEGWLTTRSDERQALALASFDHTRQTRAWRWPDVGHDAWIDEVADFAVHTVWSGALRGPLEAVLETPETRRLRFEDLPFARPFDFFEEPLPPGIPALWGPRSFSVGASMARQGKAASFIWHNMPLGLGKSLTPQESFDVAAYITAKPRPDSPGKQSDWPHGGAPADVPYATKGRSAFRPPPLLARANPREAMVEVPRSISRRTTP